MDTKNGQNGYNSYKKDGEVVLDVLGLTIFLQNQASKFTALPSSCG